jgi:magnesium-protoporphyrin IX monomethyl ester (oxidative) cyclase
MYLNDLQRSSFYSAIGLDANLFDKHVIRKTNQSAGTLFPVIFDTEHPEFFPLLDKCAEANQNLIDIEKEGSSFSFFKKLPSYVLMASSLLKLYTLPAIETNYIWTE